jgi:hypothetical protein
MRRIDLVCKLLGPLFIALIDGISTETALKVNLVMNVCSVVVEYYSIAKVGPQVQPVASRFDWTLLTVHSRYMMKFQSYSIQRRRLIDPGQNLNGRISSHVSKELVFVAHGKL